MWLPRLRLTERQFLMLLMGATLAAVGAAVVGSSFLAGRGSKVEPDTQARIRWMRPGQGGARAVVADYFDPSLMSLPNPRGYSRVAWAHLSPPAPNRYEPIQLAAFLPAPTGSASPTLLQQTALPDLVRAGLVNLPPGGEDLVPVVPASAPVTNSVIKIEGGLAGRRVRRFPVLPLAPPELPLRRTRILVAVDAAGRVRHAVLDRSCGHEALDTEAIQLTRELRFETTASHDPLAVTWGAARFIWASAPGN